MYQISEVLNLIFDTIGLLITVRLLWSGLIPKFYFLILGFVCVWLSNIFTVVEGFIFPDFFNVLEHSFYFISSLLFLVSLKKEILVAH
ncbi:hypothetical protein [Leptospira meyeri]|uniref:hypothetical protein n=1 Tax=Leptospira meyeri TaxID=29508 RepID=UPI0002BF92F2|nr:hypothetical protein [Leptospira meyeri]PKA25129.1 hypothetical protein CH381_17350 [Leptospira sp. mixed culture ATI2-C-A1]EMJ88287.1 hypothetical protein LEP1GSC196_2339 [Leptospira meyeri serovar Semaranga str. Veldrot Semarang 173]PJZ79907.1 hypothetical protein CH359_15400 [Leptospira meyeri]PJZ96135.1 hypothetical protein CH358_14510 [Leptospira meyeri]PKA14027.1 hypothetical protein CH372_01640 [Leptospira meyeri]